MPAGVPRMAAGDAFHGKPEAAQRPVAIYGLDGISGAGRLIPAMRAEPRAYEILVAANHLYQGFAHKRQIFCDRDPKASVKALGSARTASG